MSSQDGRNLFKLMVAPLTTESYYSRSNDMEIVLRGKGLWMFDCEKTAKFVDPRVESLSLEYKSDDRNVDEELSEEDEHRKNLALA